MLQNIGIGLAAFLLGFYLGVNVWRKRGDMIESIAEGGMEQMKYKLKKAKEEAK